MTYLTRTRGSATVISVIVLLLIVAAAGYFFISKQGSEEVSYDDSPASAPQTELDATNNNTAIAETVKGGEHFGDTGDCPAGEDWFPHSQTPRADDAGFASSSNCEFHQWSWQTFLWLTQNVDGQPRFMSFATPESLLGIELDGMLVRGSKGDSSQSFDEYLQAGTDGIMIAHNGRAIYYSQYLDDTFVDFIKSNNLTDPSAVQAFIANDPGTPFPVGAMELKVSWMVVEDGDDVSGMFTTNTKVSKLINKDGRIVVDPTQTEDVKVALVGFHIAGVVKDHPEMIWATFEHHKNAPNVPNGLKMDEVVSSDDYTFYTGGTPLSGCNVNYSDTNKLVLDEATQKFSPVTQVCRQYQYGNQEGVNKKNDKNIEDLNAHVGDLFASNGDDIWSNYSEVGAIWFKLANPDGPAPLKPGQSLIEDTLLSGSLRLSNSTIETFTQVASAQDNCFRCHNTLQAFPPKLNLDPLPASNLNISHAFQNIYFWSQESADTE